MFPCSVCGDLTDWCCSDCRIDRGEKIYVCENPECRDSHEALGVCGQVNVERIIL